MTHNGHREDRGAYLPTADEIAEAARGIREEGFVGEKGHVYRPWDEQTEQKKAGALARVPFEFSVARFL